MTELSLPAPNVLLADDEPLLLEAIESELSSVWPEATVLSRCRSGLDAIEALQTLPIDIAFLDIQMPEANGLEVVQTVIEEWPEEAHRPMPLFVFVTAYTEHAIDAFKLAAVDYIVKPITAKRMADTVERLKHHQNTRALANAPEELNQQIVNLLTNTPNKTTHVEKLQTVRASVGEQVYLIPIEDVILFEASDKYIEVHTASKSVVIRESLRNLLPQLDPTQFTQIHRKSIVNLRKVNAAVRENNGKMKLNLHESSLTPVVSRLYRHLFQAQ